MLPHVSLGASQLLEPASTSPRSYGRRQRSRHYEPQAQTNCSSLHRQHREATAAGIGPGTTAMYMQRTTSSAAVNGLGATTKYLRRKINSAANNDLSTTIIPPCSAASFEVNSEPYTGARPSVRLCVGPELARCVHKTDMIIEFFS